MLLIRELSGVFFVFAIYWECVLYPGASHMSNRTVSLTRLDLRLYIYIYIYMVTLLCTNTGINATGERRAMLVASGRPLQAEGFRTT